MMDPNVSDTVAAGMESIKDALSSFSYEGNPTIVISEAGFEDQCKLHSLLISKYASLPYRHTADILAVILKCLTDSDIEALLAQSFYPRVHYNHQPFHTLKKDAQVKKNLYPLKGEIIWTNIAPFFPNVPFLSERPVGKSPSDIPN